MRTPKVCPACDEDVPPNAKACPTCGADERSGWNKDALMYDGLDLPDEAWGDDENTTQNGVGLAWHWRVVAVVCVILVVLWMARG
jgi:hypothetical protein